jgi:hypothetical protein
MVDISVWPLPFKFRLTRIAVSFVLRSSSVTFSIAFNLLFLVIIAGKPASQIRTNLSLSEAAYQQIRYVLIHYALRHHNQII